MKKPAKFFYQNEDGHMLQFDSGIQNAVQILSNSVEKNPLLKKYYMYKKKCEYIFFEKF